MRRPPRSTRTDDLFPYTTLFRSFAVAASPRVDDRFDIFEKAGVGGIQACGHLLRRVSGRARHADREMFELGRIFHRQSGHRHEHFDRKNLGIVRRKIISEENRVGKECGSTCKYRWWT